MFNLHNSGSNPIKDAATVVLEISILLARQVTGAILVDIGELAVTQDLGVAFCAGVRVSAGRPFSSKPPS